MVQRLAARARSLDRDREVLFDFGLSNELRKPLRPELQLKGRIVLNRRGGNQAVALVAEMRSVSERGHGKAIVKRKWGAGNRLFVQTAGPRVLHRRKEEMWRVSVQLE